MRDPGTAEERLLALLQAIAIEQRPCKLCGCMLYIVRLRSGDRAYFNGEGINHFTNCPKARPTPAAQDRLFDPPAEAALDPH